MKIKKTMMLYCPRCNKHTLHTALKKFSMGRNRAMNVATRRHNRAIKGYVGSVEPKIEIKKLAKRQTVLLECKECKYVLNKTFGSRTKKKIEIKLQ